MEDRDEKFEQELDDSLTPEPTNEDKLDLITRQLVDDAILEEDGDKFNRMIGVFNQYMAKKKMARCVKAGNALEKATDEAFKRISNDPDDISDRDLANYIQLLHKIESGYQDSINGISDKPVININAQTNNISMPSISDESSKKILEAVAVAMEMAAQSQVQDVEEVEIVDEEEE